MEGWEGGSKQAGGRGSEVNVTNTGSAGFLRHLGLKNRGDQRLIRTDGGGGSDSEWGYLLVH